MKAKKERKTVKEELAVVSKDLSKLSEHTYNLIRDFPHLPKGCKKRLTRKDVTMLKVRIGLLYYTLKLKRNS